MVARDDDGDVFSVVWALWCLHSSDGCVEVAAVVEAAIEVYGWHDDYGSDRGYSRHCHCYALDRLNAFESLDEWIELNPPKPHLVEQSLGSYWGHDTIYTSRQEKKKTRSISNKEKEEKKTSFHVFCKIRNKHDTQKHHEKNSPMPKDRMSVVP